MPTQIFLLSYLPFKNSLALVPITLLYLEFIGNLSVSYVHTTETSLNPNHLQPWKMYDPRKQVQKVQQLTQTEPLAQQKPTKSQAQYQSLKQTQKPSLSLSRFLHSLLQQLALQVMLILNSSSSWLAIMWII